MRSWHRMGYASLAVAALACGPAAAQAVSDGANAKKFSDIEGRLGGAKADVSSDAIGVTLAPGVIWTPSAFVEGGYDSNPDRLFDEKGSAFLRTGAGMGLTSISEQTIAALSGNGSWLGFADDLNPDSRLSGGAAASVTHRLAPGLSVGASGLYDHDASKMVVSDTKGASAELGYNNDIVASFVRGRIVDVAYGNSYPVIPPSDASVAPLFASSAFSARKDDVSAGALLWPAHSLSPYVEAGAARIDYTDQKLPALVNRDADDYYVKSGLRVVFTPHLRADVGWRWNDRETEGAAPTTHRSDFFDGNLTWTPSRYFALSASLERAIGEPTTGFGLMSDLRTYELKATYLPVQGVTMSLGAQRQVGTEIGGDFHYRNTILDAGVAYDYTSHIQLYSGLRYEFFDVDWRDQEYNRLKVLAGVRIIPDGRSLTQGGNLDELAARLERPRLPDDADLTVSTGYSLFSLPGVKMTTIVGGPFFDQSIDHATDDDGKAHGGRIDVKLSNMAQYVTPSGKAISFGASGFFAAYSNVSKTSCYYTATTDCAFVNIVDFNPNEENNTGAFGLLDTVTKRDALYYGAALDARLAGVLASWKDDLPDVDYSPFKVGVAARGLNQSTKLNSRDPAVCLPVKYSEKLDAHYFGGFFGVEKLVPLGAGWSASMDGAVGLYYADASYEGRYTGYVAVVSPVPGFVEERGGVNGSADKGAFIGSLRLALNRDLGWGSLGVYGEAEYLSYVPTVLYNDNDQAGGAPWGLRGAHSETRLSSDDAMNYSAGVSLKVKLK